MRVASAAAGESGSELLKDFRLLSTRMNWTTGPCWTRRRRTFSEIQLAWNGSTDELRNWKALNANWAEIL